MRQDLIYNGIIDFCRENNVEGLAYRISELATISLFHRETGKIYSALTTEYQYTGEIAKKVGISSKDVSSLLTQLYKNSNLISVMRDGKLKSWARKS